jgi:hypothetical protein
VQLNRQLGNFFFKKEDCSTIGLIRIFTAAVLLLSLLNDLSFVSDYYSNEGVISGRTDIMRSEYRFSILDIFGSPEFVYFFYILLVISTIMLLFGKYTKATAIVSFLLLASFHEKNIFVLNSGDTLIRLLLFYLILAPSEKCLSLDAIKKKKGVSAAEFKKWQQSPIWPRRLMQIQLAIVYLFAFMPKTGITWKSGTALYYFLANPHFARFSFDSLGTFIGLTALMTHTTLLIELLFPILIWFKSTRKYMLIAGISLNAGILILSNITFFSLIMIVAHLAFIEPKTANRVITKIKKLRKK